MKRCLITAIVVLAAVFALSLASCGQQGDQAQVEPGTQTDQSAQAPGEEQMDGQQAAPSTPIDINAASVEELASIPGLDQTLAQNIIDYRESYGPFSSVDDLLQVSGRDQQTLDSIRMGNGGARERPCLSKHSGRRRDSSPARLPMRARVLWGAREASSPLTRNNRPRGYP